jgi:hypothetical protein
MFSAKSVRLFTPLSADFLASTGDQGAPAETGDTGNLKI